MNKVVIIDYHMGNLRSLYNKFRRLNINCLVTSDSDEILMADKLILPGVGHFKKGIDNLKILGLDKILLKKVIEEKTPILGICLGMQLFCKRSEEGDAEGLGWIDAEVIRFRVSDKIKYKVPHMGWNNVKIIKRNSLDNFINNDDHFYFVHSYHVKCNNVEDVWMTSIYDYEFVSAIYHDNIIGTQFHPEKSHDAGFEFLKRFVEL